MEGKIHPESHPVTVKLMGREYRLRTDMDPERMQDVADYVERALSETRRSTSDTQDAAILAALNIASDLLHGPKGPGIPRKRVQALIDLIDSV